MDTPVNTRTKSQLQIIKFFFFINKPFLSYPVPLFQNESVQNLSYENEFETEPGGAHILI